MGWSSWQTVPFRALYRGADPRPRASPARRPRSACRTSASGSRSRCGSLATSPRPRRARPRHSDLGTVPTNLSLAPPAVASRLRTRRSPGSRRARTGRDGGWIRSLTESPSNLLARDYPPRYNHEARASPGMEQFPRGVCGPIGIPTPNRGRSVVPEGSPRGTGIEGQESHHGRRALPSPCLSS